MKSNLNTLLFVYDSIYHDYTKYKRKRKLSEWERKCAVEIFREHLLNLQKIIKKEAGNTEITFKELL